MVAPLSPRRHKAAAYDREEALRDVRREQEFLAGILEQSSQPFAVGYPDGRLGRFNRAYAELTGYTAAELRTLDWSAALTPPEWRGPEQEYLEELRRTGQPVRYEKEYVRKDGSRVPVELLVHLVRDAAGQAGVLLFVPHRHARAAPRRGGRAGHRRTPAANSTPRCSRPTPRCRNPAARP